MWSPCLWSGNRLRAAFGPMGRRPTRLDDIIASELFRGVDADERLAEKADTWRRTLIAKGFHEIAK